MKSHERAILRTQLHTHREQGDQERTKAHTDLQEAEAIIRKAEARYVEAQKQITDAKAKLSDPTALQALKLAQDALPLVAKIWEEDLHTPYNIVVAQWKIVDAQRGYIGRLPDEMASINQGMTEGTRSLVVIREANATLAKALEETRVQMGKLTAEIEKIEKLLAEASEQQQVAERERAAAEAAAKRSAEEESARPSFNEEQVLDVVRALHKSKPLSGSEPERLTVVMNQVFSAIDMLNKTSDSAAKPTKDDFPVILSVVNTLLGPAENDEARQMRTTTVQTKFVAWLLEAHSVAPTNSSGLQTGNNGAAILHMHQHQTQNAAALQPAVGVDGQQKPVGKISLQ